MSQDQSINEILENNKVEPFTLAHDILVNWWVILLGALAAAMLTFVGASLRYEPQYTTSATFAVVSVNGTAYSNLSSANTMAGTFQKIIESSSMNKILCEQLHVDYVDADINTSIVENTNLLELSVAADSPKDAYDIIHIIMDNYSSISYYSVGGSILETLQEPSIPMSPTNPLNAGRLMKMAFLAVGALLVLLFGGLSYLKDTVKREDEIEQKLDARSLGKIIYESKYKSLRDLLKRHKNALLVNQPLAGFGFVESYRKFVSRVEYRMEKHDSKVVIVTSVSENEGKSTVAANLAISLADRDKKVILIDGDLRRPSQFLIMGLKPDEKSELGEFLKGDGQMQNLMRKTEVKGVFFMGGRNCYSSSTDILQSDRTKELIDACRKLVDYVVIDTPPVGIVADAEIYARYADEVCLVVRQNYILAEDINDALDRFRNAGCRILGVVLNRVQSFSTLTNETVGRYTSRYGYGRYGKYGNYADYSKKQRESNE